MMNQKPSESDRAPRVGFIGLGDMGGPMASSIARAGMDLSVFDLREEAMSKLTDEGARRARSVAELAAEVDVLCTCVVYDHQVRDLFLGEAGILAGALPGLVALIHSTILPETVEEVDRRATENGVEIIDAPVSGASSRAATGDLTVMVGAGDDAFAKAQPVIETFAANVFRLGPPGQGQVAKLANNIMALCNQAVATEAVRFAESMGLDRGQFFDIAHVSAGASWAADNYEHHDRYGLEHTLAGTGELPAELSKDLRTAVSVAEANGTYLPIVGLCGQIMPALLAQRWADVAAKRDAG